MKTKYKAIIIGSGIIGCSIAFELSKKGWKTLNVDNILKQDNRIKGVELADATVIEAPVVVNASGPILS